MNILNTLLRLYPRAWRARYEEEFTALLEQNRLSLIDIGDIALGALDAHLRPQVSATQVQSERRPPVNRGTFIKWSGMAGMAGSVLSFLGLVGTSVLSDDEYAYYYDAVDVAAVLVFLTGVAFLLVFAVGFAINYARKIGPVGQLGLLVMLVGLLVLGAGVATHLMETIRRSPIDGWWGYFMLGMAGTLLGGALVALAGALLRSLPPVGSRVAAVGGFGTLAILVLSMGFFGDLEVGAAQTAVIVATVALLATFKVGLFLLGYALWAGREPAPARMESATAG
jgi:hypothetical protein